MRIAIISCFLLLAFAVASSTEVPRIISYQGTLKDADGVIVPDGEYDFTFRIYDVDTGGAPLWTEDQTLSVSAGVFDAYLGAVTTLDLDFDVPYWLGVSIAEDEELSPRFRLTATSYTFRACVADSALKAAEAEFPEHAHDDLYYTKEELNTEGTLNDPANPVDWSKLKSVPPGFADGIDDAGEGDGHSLDAADGDPVDAVYVDDAGYVGVGTTTPIQQMDINGNMRAYSLQATSLFGGLRVNNIWTGETALYEADGFASAFQQEGAIGGLRLRVADYGSAGEEVSWIDALQISREGMVGIGTPTPAHELDVNGRVRAYDLHATSQFGGVRVNNDWTGEVSLFEADGYASNIQQYGTLGGLRFRVADYGIAGTVVPWLVAMRITKEGDVGIGTTFPEAKLGIQGSSNVIDAFCNFIGEENLVAVAGRSLPADGYGYGGDFTGGYKGVYGQCHPIYNSTYYGVHGSVTGGSGTNYGVYGFASGSGTNWAGYFDGDVMVTGTLSKGGGSFQIDHPLDPENKYLYHSFVESPDMKNIYDGVARLDRYGEAWVEMPEWFEALNMEFRYQLTCIGSFAQVYIAEEIANNRFKIAGGEPGMKISWQVTGVRHDPFAETHRIPVEQLKSADERGLYLHADAYGQPEERSVTYRHRQRDEQKSPRLDSDR